MDRVVSNSWGFRSPEREEADRGLARKQEEILAIQSGPRTDCSVILGRARFAEVKEWSERW